MFVEAGRPEWARRLKYIYPSMNRTSAPSAVDVYCLYGSEVPTTYTFAFAEDILDGAPVEKGTMEVGA